MVRRIAVKVRFGSLADIPIQAKNATLQRLNHSRGVNRLTFACACAEVHCAKPILLSIERSGDTVIVASTAKLEYR